MLPGRITGVMLTRVRTSCTRLPGRRAATIARETTLGRSLGGHPQRTAATPWPVIVTSTSGETTAWSWLPGPYPTSRSRRTRPRSPPATGDGCSSPRHGAHGRPARRPARGPCRTAVWRGAHRRPPTSTPSTSGACRRAAPRAGTRVLGCRPMENTEPFDVREPLILLSLGRSHQRGVNPYGAARFAWKIDRARAGRYGLVLAHSRGIVVGAFRPERWLPATRRELPGQGHAPRPLGFCRGTCRARDRRLLRGETGARPVPTPRRRQSGPVLRTGVTVRGPRQAAGTKPQR